MLLSLLVPVVLARGPDFALSAGGVVGMGSVRGTEFTTFSPMVSGNVVWHTWFLEEWIGLSSTALLSTNLHESWLAAPLQAEFGIGIGGEHFGLGLFNGFGFGGSLVGVYGQASFPINRRNYGVEVRLFTTGADELAAGAVLARVELGPERRKKKAPPPTRKAPPPPPEPPPPVYHPEPF